MLFSRGLVKFVRLEKRERNAMMLKFETLEAILRGLTEEGTVLKGTMLNDTMLKRDDVERNHNQV